METQHTLSRTRIPYQQKPHLHWTFVTALYVLKGAYSAQHKSSAANGLIRHSTKPNAVNVLGSMGTDSGG